MGGASRLLFWTGSESPLESLSSEIVIKWGSGGKEGI